MTITATFKSSMPSDTHFSISAICKSDDGTIAAFLPTERNCAFSTAEFSFPRLQYVKRSARLLIAAGKSRQC